MGESSAIKGHANGHVNGFASPKPMTPGPNGNSSVDFRRTYKHEKYFLNGGDVHFLVGECHFRVHSYFFTRESPRFDFLVGHLATGKGNTLHTAIKLHQATAEEFEKLLWVFYNPKFGIFKAPVEHWRSILKLAYLWGFPEVKELAVRELEKLHMSDVDRVALYEAYEVAQDLIFPLIMKLCKREDNLDYVEAQKLGMQTAVMVYQGRELLRSSPGSGGKSPLPKGLDEQDAHKKLKEIMSRMPSLPKINEFNGIQPDTPV